MNQPTISSLIEQACVHPFLHEHLSVDALSPSGYAHAQLQDLRIESGYQPIFDVSMGGIQTLWSSPESADRFGDELGFHALTLQPGGISFDPFENTNDNHELIALDRLVRTLHAINFFGSQRRGLLFLPVHDQLLKSVIRDHGQHFSSVLVSLGLNPSRIAIELPGTAVAHRTFLDCLTKSYRHYGFKVAGNLPNAGHIMTVSDTARLDFLRIDGPAVLRDSMVRPLIAYANRLQIPLIFDRIATAAEFNVLQQFGARFVQGPLFEPQTSSTTEQLHPDSIAREPAEPPH
ncbi:MAG TPA: EAL domain-containing protein [Trinickia sp.]|jgi:EAL domain-containing protein (putative c-di-GMP-specific phosphodiesterase class I)|uniref:EAL domain-containing protein n=1 Tax=Trinickia sp. TaxID=2571163 RepID=UPI002D0B3632|nr:EAL domain-containing protein [Trinickia sp.]HTI18830.1 EAL domain-containing protein [Trinickia sp.]